MKILLAVDGSACTKRMLAWLATHDEVLAKGGSYTFLHVVTPVPPQVTHFVDRGSIEDYYRDTAKAVLDPVAEFARRHGWTHDTRSTIGRSGDEIAKAAEEGGYDLVVRGSHGHSAAAGLLMGSVAQRVLAACRAPVMIVR